MPKISKLRLTQKIGDLLSAYLASEDTEHSPELTAAIQEDAQRFEGQCLYDAHKAIMEAGEFDEISPGKFIWGEITSVDRAVLAERVCSS